MTKKFALMLISLMTLASCASIEDATKKWKTPETSNAGVSEGEKSHYLLDKTESPVSSETSPSKPASKPKSKAKTKKK